MRATIATLSLLASTYALPATFGSSPVDGNSLFRRQAITGNICAPVNLGLTIPDFTGTCPGTTNAAGDCVISFANGVCLCLADGQLTDASITTINSIVSNSPIIGDLTPVLGSVETIVGQVEQVAINILGADTTNCDYPAGAIPDSCTDCSFGCPAGQKVCGDQCVDDDVDCVSGVPTRRRKRDFLSGPDVLCPAGFTACGIPTSPIFTGRNFECIDTNTNIESCGACAFPLPGAAIGVDCTTIPHTLQVGCSAGKCVVDACERGFELNEDASACVAISAEAMKAKKRSAKDSIKNRQVKVEQLKARGANN